MHPHHGGGGENSSCFAGQDGGREGALSLLLGVARAELSVGTSKVQTPAESGSVGARKGLWPLVPRGLSPNSR